MLGRHDDAILGLGFQGGTVTARRNCTASTVDVTAACCELENEKMVEGAPDGSAGVMSRKHRNMRNSVISSCRAGGAGGPGHSDSPTEDGIEEESAGFGLVVLSACIDGSVKAWETLGMSEKYRMKHPTGDEVTSMLILPGGSILATGETGTHAVSEHHSSTTDTTKFPARRVCNTPFLCLS